MVFLMLLPLSCCCCQVLRGPLTGAGPTCQVGGRGTFAENGDFYTWNSITAWGNKYYLYFMCKVIGFS